MRLKKIPAGGDRRAAADARRRGPMSCGSTPVPPGSRDLVRLSFGDSPDLGEAERVAEIAHTKVWADGQPLEVKRLPDGLEARLPDRRPAVVSAFADRGIVTYMGDSFIIYLAAYAQTQAIEPNRGHASGPGRRPGPAPLDLQGGRTAGGAGPVEGQARGGRAGEALPRPRRRPPNCARIAAARSPART